MIVICDDTEFAQSFLEESVTWKLNRQLSLTKDVAAPLKYIFNSDRLFQGKIESEQRWQYLLMVKFAHISQFEILCQLCRNHKLNVANMLCLAGASKNFKGFKNRSWQSIPGNLHLSAYLAPQKALAHFHVGFTLVAVNAAVQTIAATPGLKSPASIKWVNDILLDKQKIGGILVQTQAQGEKVMGAVLGIGINVEQTPHIIPDIFVPQAGCLWNFTPNRDPLLKVRIFKDLLDNLYKNYHTLLAGNYKYLFDFYTQHSCILGHDVALYSDPYTGTPQLMMHGKVERIGTNLELYFVGVKEPVYTGRLAFTT